MRKAIVLVLALILTLSLAVPAAAVISPVGTLPGLISSTTVTEDGATIEVTFAKPGSLTESEKAMMDEAKKAFDEGKKGMSKVLFFEYARTTTTKDGITEEGGIGAISFKLQTTKKIVARQFDGEKWVDLDVEYDAATGIVTIKNIGIGPLIIGIE